LTLTLLPAQQNARAVVTLRLADGSVLVTGGNNSNRTSAYQPVTNTWAAGANMTIPRGYHSMVTLSDGRVFAIGGSWSGGQGGKDGEVWSPATGWQRLPGAPVGPILTAEAAAANFTNEGGAGGTIRFLKNVMGLWVLEGCRREWGGAAPDIDALVAGAGALAGPAGVIDVDDLGLLNPPSMMVAIRAQLRATGQRVPETPIELARVIFDSLALGYARVVAMIERLTGEPVAGIHIVGGGSRNAYLNQATADATGRVTFNDLQQSQRYPGGLALRFARIKGYRPDKRAADADTMEAVRKIFASQDASSASA